MSKFLWTLMLLITVILAFASCGEKKEAARPLKTGDFLAESFPSISAVRASEVATFVGDSLYEYIDGGAEIYHAYKFVEVVTATYTVSGREIVADIYSFETAPYAYGLYTANRSEEPHLIDLGIEGQVSSSSIDFVKGFFVVRLTAFEESPEVSAGLDALARQLADQLPGTLQRPEAFGLLPTDGCLPATDKMYAQSFLGQQTLTEVYSQSIISGPDTLVLFVTTDAGGKKFSQWREALGQDSADISGIEGIPFAPGQSLKYTDAYYGDIIAGLKGGFLAGVIGYKPSCRELIASWLQRLP